MLGPEGYVTPGQVMTYTIMFENEGQGTAFDVYVTDIFDGNLDDSNIVIKDFYLVDWATNIETSTTLPYSYDPQSHKLTVLAGTFDSRQGGKFTVELRLKPDVAQGTVVKNFATVYFPTALEETRTNSIISAVPQPATVAYTGSTVAVYSSYAMIAATVTSFGQTLLGKTVNFYIGDSSFTTVTGGSGEASVYPQVDIPPGNYQITAAFPGDGYYYTSSTQTSTLQVLRAETYISDFSTITYSTTPVIAVAMTNSKGVQILHQDIEAKTLQLEYLDGETWKPLGQATLSSGTAVFQFPLPQPLTTTYQLKAKFSGDNKYFQTESTATLAFADITPPVTELSINGFPIEDGAAVNILNTDTITITAEDFGAGNKDVLYTWDFAFSTQAATAYAMPFALPVGSHTIFYSAMDNMGNLAPVKNVVVFISESKTIIWSGLASDGDWYNPGNWSANVVPGPYDNAVLATRDTVVVSSNSHALHLHNLVLGDEEGLSAPILKISTGVVSSGVWTLYRNATLMQNTTEQIIIATLIMHPGSILNHNPNTNTR
ncbi:MAG TPA: hypothetical protein DCZ93_01830, partial [Elusimicrobia bacterium]|nr:hypothetical protein [Elusimicrobiota bacterium]